MEQRIAPSSASAFTYPSFQRYWAARLCVTLAIQMQAVAIGWQIYDLTRRPLDLGLVGLAQFLPSLGLALVTGHVADRYDRRTVMALCIIVEALCAVLFLTFTLQGGTQTPFLFGVLVLFGTARAFEFPASVALMPNLVPPRLFTNAAAWSSSSWQVATIVGPAIGGLLYAIGPEAVYGCCVLMFLLSVFLVNTIRIEHREKEQMAATWESVGAGISFIRGQPVVLGAVSLDLFAVLLGGATALLPVYARGYSARWSLGARAAEKRSGSRRAGHGAAHRPPAHSASCRRDSFGGSRGLRSVHSSCFGLSHNLLAVAAGPDDPGRVRHDQRRHSAGAGLGENAGTRCVAGSVRSSRSLLARQTNSGNLSPASPRPGLGLCPQWCWADSAPWPLWACGCVFFRSYAESIP